MKQIINLINSLKSNNKVIIIGIDGPTASGKTTLAQNLQKTVSNSIIIPLDWALKSRQDRLNDLEILKKIDTSFEFEAENHMNLNVIELFLKKVKEFNESDEEYITLLLDNLYSREDNGNLTGKQKIELKKGMVIFAEGHYTLRTELDIFIDYNILLLGNNEEFLSRKIERAHTYRKIEDVKDYFWKIDIPSFKNHIQKYGYNANLIIDNTDYTNPEIKDYSYLKIWDNQETKYKKYELTNIEDLPNSFFSESLFSNNDLKEKLKQAVLMIQTWDSKVGNYLRTKISSLKTDLKSMAEENVLKLNQNSTKYKFRLMHTDALYNVYYRKLPISFSIGLYGDKETPIVSICAEIFQDNLRIQMSWEGSYKQINFKRELGKVINKNQYELNELKEDFLNISAEKLNVLLPTHFTLPSFLKEYDYNLIFIRKEDEVISAPQAMHRIITKGGVWIHRFALFSELIFYQNMLKQAGITSVRIGYYLISLKHYDQNLRLKFKEFINEWKTPIKKEKMYLESNKKMDLLVLEEREVAKKKVEESKHFIMMDGYLFSNFMYKSEEEVKEAILELKQIMLSPTRLLRKRANQFVLRFFPVINLNTKELWNDVPKNSKETITLENYNRLSPSIMAELYQWLAIRNERASVLATNIYDIKKKSYDSLAYLDAASNLNTPIVLQVSLNAAGQEEKDEKGKKIQGYLKLPNGPEDFFEATSNAARDLYLTKGVLPPLFGFGLDHVSVNQDIPKGRAKRFLNKSLATGKLTHYVQDGAALFDAEHRDKESLTKAYLKMTDYSCSLIDDLKKLYLIDREICAGELNYVSDTDTPLIPTNKEMKLFVDCMQESIKKSGQEALLSRPMLFIGNVGTTHHGYDRVKPSVEVAKKWRDAIKSENFISPVLHGTTNSHRDVLRNAATGCHKINVAGDLLNVMVSNLPEKISRIIHDSNVDPKRMMASIRFLMEELNEDEKDKLHKALYNVCSELITTINSPKLTSMDSSYFHYNNYNYPPSHVDVIIKEIISTINKYKTSKKTKTKSQFSSSMIEVPEEEMEKYLSILWKKGIRNFHIDAGDGEFITRQISGIRKAKMIKKLYPNAELHAHLMIKNPHFPHDGTISPIQQYVEAGCDAVAIHPRSFDKVEETINALKFIRNLGCRPGILIETHDTINGEIEKIINQAEIDWVIVMGVPIGYGGQIFQFTTLNLLQTVNEFFKQRGKPYLIEADGGLTLQTVKLCKNAGATLFAGWSIIKSDNIDELANNIDKLNKVLEEE